VFAASATSAVLVFSSNSSTDSITKSFAASSRAVLSSMSLATDSAGEAAISSMILASDSVGGASACCLGGIVATAGAGLTSVGLTCFGSI